VAKPTKKTKRATKKKLAERRPKPSRKKRKVGIGKSMQYVDMIGSVVTHEDLDYVKFVQIGANLAERFAEETPMAIPDISKWKGFIGKAYRETVWRPFADKPLTHYDYDGKPAS
jgi:hypothetical protein